MMKASGRRVRRVVALAGLPVAVAVSLVLVPGQAAADANPDGTRVTWYPMLGDDTDGTRVTGVDPDGTRVTWYGMMRDGTDGTRVTYEPFH